MRFFVKFILEDGLSAFWPWPAGLVSLHELNTGDCLLLETCIAFFGEGFHCMLCEAFEAACGNCFWLQSPVPGGFANLAREDLTFFATVS